MLPRAGILALALSLQGCGLARAEGGHAPHIATPNLPGVFYAVPGEDSGLSILKNADPDTSVFTIYSHTGLPLSQRRDGGICSLSYKMRKAPDARSQQAINAAMRDEKLPVLGDAKVIFDEAFTLGPLVGREQLAETDFSAFMPKELEDHSPPVLGYVAMLARTDMVISLSCRVNKATMEADVKTFRFLRDAIPLPP